MSLFSLSNNLTFEKDLLPTKVSCLATCSKIVRNLDQRELSVETLGPLVAPSLLQPGALGFLQTVVPLVSVLYLEVKGHMRLFLQVRNQYIKEESRPGKTATLNTGQKE